jgi:hypothetical protein
VPCLTEKKGTGPFFLKEQKSRFLTASWEGKKGELRRRLCYFDFAIIGVADYNMEK